MLPQGDYLFQRLSLDESLIRTHEVFRKGFVTFVLISSVVLVLQALVWSMIFLPMLKATLFGKTEDMFIELIILTKQGGKMKVMLMMMVQATLSVVFTSIAAGSMIRVVSDIYADRYNKPDSNSNHGNLYWLHCLKMGCKVNGHYLITLSILTLIARVIGLHLVMLPGIYLMGLWFVVYPVVVIEFSSNNTTFKNTIKEALLQRCSFLVKSSWFYVICTFISMYVAAFAIKIIWSFLLLEFHATNMRFMESDDGGQTFHYASKKEDLYLTMLQQAGQMIWSLLLTNGNGPGHALLSTKDTFLAIVPELFILPVLSILQTVIYFNLRTEKEAMNFRMLLQHLDDQVPSNADSDGTATNNGVMMTMNNNYGDYSQVSLIENNEGVQQQQQQHTTANDTENNNAQVNLPPQQQSATDNEDEII